jgi:hypothetical protein
MVLLEGEAVVAVCERKFGSFGRNFRLLFSRTYFDNFFLNFVEIKQKRKKRKEKSLRHSETAELKATTSSALPAIFVAAFPSFTCCALRCDLL